MALSETPPTVAALVVLALLGAGGPALARSPYDGLWAVSFVPDQGDCDRHDVEVFVRNGEISHVGDRGFFTAEGTVGEQGRVEASIGALGLTVSAEGRLAERQGGGTWAFPERGCAGRWSAERRSPVPVETSDYQ
jgi:hypothetical protein